MSGPTPTGFAPSTCPRCHVPLATAQHGAWAILACSTCAGVFVGAGEAARLLAPLTDVQPHDPGRPALPCPTCRHPMTALSSATARVEVDRCDTHGVWFDRDEITHVAHAIARMRGTPPPAVPGPVITAGHVGGAAAVLAAGDALQRRSSSSGWSGTDTADVAAEVAVHGTDLVDMGTDVARAGADVAIVGVETVGDVAEASGGILEGAAEVLGGVLGALGELFS